VKRKHIIKDKKIERVTNFFVRLPNWLGDVVMAIPVLIAIRKGRPDVRFTLVCKCEYIGLLRKFDLGEDYLALPKRGFRYFFDFRKLLIFKPDNYLLFTNSVRGDLEAFLSGSRQRFGLNLPNRLRPLLSHTFDLAIFAEERLKKMHQTELWEQMAMHFGLKEIISKEPIYLNDIIRRDIKIGIVPGSSNSPKKRWTPENWVSLINQLSSIKKDLVFHLYGTNQDAKITSIISSHLVSSSVYDHAGKTELSELAEELASCSLVIGNDTGSIHLANMVGTPVVVLFGPTSSARTSPFFNPRKLLIESPNSEDINSLTPETVYQKTISFI
jgi:ADP-heptose:LPS heptosyltransferase